MPSWEHCSHASYTFQALTTRVAYASLLDQKKEEQAWGRQCQTPILTLNLYVDFETSTKTLTLIYQKSE